MRGIPLKIYQSQSPIAHTDGGMHKSSEHSDKDCVWNEDAPTVISCALFFGQAKFVVILSAGSFAFRHPLLGRKGMQNENTGFI